MIRLSLNRNKFSSYLRFQDIFCNGRLEEFQDSFSNTKIEENNNFDTNQTLFYKVLQYN